MASWNKWNNFNMVNFEVQLQVHDVWKLSEMKCLSLSLTNLYTVAID